MVEYYEQTSLEMFGSTKDPAMVKTVEDPSASRDIGESGGMQRTESRCQGRNHVSMNLDKAHVTSGDLGHLKAGDSCREKGGTQEFPKIEMLSICKKRVFSICIES